MPDDTIYNIYMNTNTSETTTNAYTYDGFSFTWTTYRVEAKSELDKAKERGCLN